MPVRGECRELGAEGCDFGGGEAGGEEAVETLRLLPFLRDMLTASRPRLRLHRGDSSGRGDGFSFGGEGGVG